MMTKSSGSVPAALSGEVSAGAADFSSRDLGRQDIKEVMHSQGVLRGEAIRFSKWNAKK